MKTYKVTVIYEVEAEDKNDALERLESVLVKEATKLKVEEISGR